MKKRLNTDAIANELREHSHFFRQSRPQAPIPPTAVPGSPDPQTPGDRDTQASGHPDAHLPGQKGIDRYDITVRAEDRQTLRLTEAELRKLGSIQARVSEELGVRKVDKNDIIRCGLHQLFDDFDELGRRSNLALRLRKKYR